jgi:pimeloyl-ACP methyl ester carboxylesterase
MAILMAERPVTRYAKSDGAYLAYQVVGEGPLDLVLVDTWIHHVELWWEFPEVARQLRRLGSLGRLIRFDRRGTGLSDPVSAESFPDLDTQVADIRAVMDAAGSARAALLGISDGGPLAIQLAATHPERCEALVLYGTSPRFRDAPEYPIGAPEAALLDLVAAISASLAAGDSTGAEVMAPSRAADRQFTETFMRLSRAAVGPGAAETYYRESVLVDVRDMLGAITAPTLVLHRTGDRLTPVTHGRYLAEHIPGARYVELGGDDHLWFTGNADELVDQVAEFLTGSRLTSPDRRLAAVLFTDIVGSTERAAAIGDREWRGVLDAHDAIVRRELARYGGTEIDHTGDGFLATFDTPSAAIRSAASLRTSLREIDVAVRAGVHAGELEVRGRQVGGLTVHIGARVCAAAGADEVLVSSTVREILQGTEFEFAHQGEHELKGVPGTWNLYHATELDRERTPRA